MVERSEVKSAQRKYYVGKYFAGAAGALVRPDTSGDIFAPINLVVDRPLAHFYEKN
jgi:hypothetical protein